MLTLSIQRLKRHLTREPDLPFAAGTETAAGEVQCLGDHAEVRTRDLGDWIGVTRRIRRAEHLHAELEFYALGDVDIAEDPDIKVEESRSPEKVASGSAEAEFTCWNGGE